MPVLIAITYYDIEEVREKLAEKTSLSRGKLSRQRVHTMIRKNIPAAQRIGGRILITDEELKWLAANLDVKHRKTTDVRQ